MAFKTFTVGEIATASDVNTYLMKQAVIVCTSGTRPSSPVEGMTIYETDTDNLVTYDGTGWRRYNARPVTATVATSETETNTAYDDMTTAGPAVTLTTGDAVLVTVTAALFNSAGNQTSMSWAVSGASTIAAADSRSIQWNGTVEVRFSQTFLQSVTAGSNTFTAKYRVTAGTGTFSDRDIIVQAV